MKLFLDTNVLIDFLLERAPFYEAAAMIISYAAEKRISVSVSAISVVNANFICIERCKMPLTIFRRKMDFLRKFMEVSCIDSAIIFQAYDEMWKDFEDGVQYQSALRCCADYIVTRNIQDFEQTEVPAISTETACSILV